jgi:UDP-2,4-diacetamido-2,4,6-trideoxy-beta-L-altropyranose hydrolase
VDTQKLSTLLIRADANPQIGTGHVMRCLALAQTWLQIGGRECLMVSYCSVEALRERIRRVVTRLVPLDASHPDESDLRETLRLAQAVQPAWIILDGYHFDPAYHEALGSAGNLLIIDDNAHLPRYTADLLLNQNVAAERLPYSLVSRRHKITPLLGPGYVLLRPAFLAYRQIPRMIQAHAAKLLVTLGGSDPDNVTLKVIQALNQLEGINARVIVGAANPHRASLEQAIQRENNIQLLSDVENMPDLMTWADLGILAGGTTLWEAALLGLPCLTLTLADNQRQNAAVMHEMGISQNLGDASMLDDRAILDAVKRLTENEDQRRQLCRRGRMLVDGQGARRVVEAMSAFDRADYTIREAGPGDAYLLWMWTNDPGTRQYAFHPEPVPWSNHIQWFCARLDSPDTRIWLYCDDAVPVGQIRYDRLSPDLALISYAVQSDQRGRGIGTQMLEITASMARQTLGVRTLRGITFAENIASHRAFEKAHFQQASTEVIEGRLCKVYEQTREV